MKTVNTFCWLICLLTASLVTAGESRFFPAAGQLGQLHSATIQPSIGKAGDGNNYAVKFALYSSSVADGGDLVLQVRVSERAGRSATTDTFYDLKRGGAVWRGNAAQLFDSGELKQASDRVDEDMGEIHCARPRVNGAAHPCYLDFQRGYLVAIDGSARRVAVEVYDFSESLALFKRALSGKEALAGRELPIALFRKYFDSAEGAGLLEQVDSVDAYHHAAEAAQLLTSQDWVQIVGGKLNSIACEQHSRFMLGQYLQDKQEKYIADALKQASACSISVVPVFEQFFNLTEGNLQKRAILVAAFDAYAKKHQSEDARCVARVIQGRECERVTAPSRVAASPKEERAKTPKTRDPVASAPAKIEAPVAKADINEEASRLITFQKNYFKVFGIAERAKGMREKPNALATFELGATLLDSGKLRIVVFQLPDSPARLKFGSYAVNLDISFDYVEHRECTIAQCLGKKSRMVRSIQKSSPFYISPKTGFSDSKDIALFDGVDDKDANAYRASYANLVMTIKKINASAR